MKTDLRSSDQKRKPHSFNFGFIIKVHDGVDAVQVY